jgi:hypothetical protein
MRTASISLPILFAALALAAGPAQSSKTPAKLLEGKVAGEPVHCISQSQIIDSYTFDDGSIFYRMTASPDYLQRPHKCSQLTSDRSYVTDTHSNQLCAGDTMNIFDASTHIPHGVCFFDDFVPYPKKASR